VGGGLRLRPASAVPGDLLADLRRHKVEVLALLTAPANDPLPPETEPGDAADDAPPVPAMRLPVIPLTDLVERMAEAMAANPVYRITNREAAMAYFRANALTRLSATNDPMARGLLLGSERHRVKGNRDE
jgi:hypothetical protein